MCKLKCTSSIWKNWKKLIAFAGVSSGRGTPDPIPNSEVKSASGDGIAGETLWESSTMPALFFLKPQLVLWSTGVFFFKDFGF